MLYPAELRGLNDKASTPGRLGSLLAQDSGRVAMRHGEHSGEVGPCHDASIAQLMASKRWVNPANASRSSRGQPPGIVG